MMIPLSSSIITLQPSHNTNILLSLLLLNYHLYHYHHPLSSTHTLMSLDDEGDFQPSLQALSIGLPVVTLPSSWHIGTYINLINSI